MGKVARRLFFSPHKGGIVGGSHTLYFIPISDHSNSGIAVWVPDMFYGSGWYMTPPYPDGPPDVSLWDRVDDPIGAADDNATYIFPSGITNAWALFSFTPIPVLPPAADNFRVSVALRTTKDSLHANVQQYIRVGGANYLIGSPFEMTDAYDLYLATIDKDPSTDLLWTQASLQTIEAYGVFQYTGIPRFTQIYMVLEYDV